MNVRAVPLEGLVLGLSAHVSPTATLSGAKTVAVPKDATVEDLAAA